MENVLLKLKRFLNSIPDNEIKDMELWINNQDTIEIICMDKNAVTLITDSDRVQIDGSRW